LVATILLGKDVSDPLPANARTGLFDVTQTKIVLAFADCVANQFCLGSFRLGGLADPFFELLISNFQDVKDVVDSASNG